MALGEITKQLATQAIGDLLESEKTAPTPGQPEKLHATILAQVQAMQKALKEDQELVVLFNAGAESVRVLEIFVPSPQVFVLSGIDAQKNTTRVISPVASTQLVCKVMKVQAPARPARVGIILPKSG